MDQGLNPQMGNVTDDDRLWALLSWLFAPLVAGIMLLIDKKARPFIKYNAVQAGIFGLAGWIIAGVLSPLAGIGCFLYPVIWIVQIVFGVQSYQGKWVTIPFLTDFVKQQGWL
jgi:uncharacterized membrane protein